MRISVVVLILTALCCGYSRAETMYLDADGTWKTIPSDARGSSSEGTERVKQLVADGRPQEASGALSEMKKDAPHLENRELELFVEAELLYSKRNFIKSAERYTRFLDEHPASDLYGSAMGRLFDIGSAFLAGQKKPLLWVFRVRAYEDGEKIMNAIADRAGNAPIAQEALVSVAKSYENRRAWRDAFRAWSDVSARWPAGQIGRDSLYGMASNLYAAYNGPQYEAGSLVSARGYYNELKARYPEFSAAMNVDELLGHIDEQIAEKELAIAMYYRRTGNPEGAGLYFSDVIEKWPDTAAAVQAQAMTGSDNR